MGVIPGVELCKPFRFLVGVEGGGGNRRHRRDRTSSPKSKILPLINADDADQEKS
jgi:hypothetical protein